MRENNKQNEKNIEEKNEKVLSDMFLYLNTIMSIVSKV